MDHIKKFRMRRDERMKNRLDDEWKTIKGTHVLIDDEGQVSGGPDSLKSLIKSSGGFKPGTKKTTKKGTIIKGAPSWPKDANSERSMQAENKNRNQATGKYKTVSDFKKALGDRDTAMSEYVQAEEDWKKAKAYRASMAGKSEESLKRDIEVAKKAGDADKLDKAQHDLERYKSGIEKYGKDFGVAAAEKKMNDAKEKHEGIDKEIKEFEKAKGFGKKEDWYVRNARDKLNDNIRRLKDGSGHGKMWRELESSIDLCPDGTKVAVGGEVYERGVDDFGESGWIIKDKSGRRFNKTSAELVGKIGAAVRGGKGDSIVIEDGGKRKSAEGESVSAKEFGDDINKVVGNLKQSMRDKKGTLTVDAKKQFSSAVKDILPKAPVGTELAFSDHGDETGLKCVKTGDNSWTTSYMRDGKKYERETTDEDVFHTLLGHTATDWKKTKSGVTASEEAGGKKESKEAETMEEGFEKEGYKKNAAGRWEAVPSKSRAPSKSFDEESVGSTTTDRPAFSTRSVASLMTGNVTNDLHGDWGRYMKKVPTGSSFTVKTGNRWHDEKETYTKTETGWRFEREVDGRGMDKGNADLSRIWNSMRDGRITEDVIPGKR